MGVERLLLPRLGLNVGLQSVRQRSICRTWSLEASLSALLSFAANRISSMIPSLSARGTRVSHCLLPRATTSATAASLCENGTPFRSTSAWTISPQRAREWPSAARRRSATEYRGRGPSASPPTVRTHRHRTSTRAAFEGRGRLRPQLELQVHGAAVGAGPGLAVQGQRRPVVVLYQVRGGLPDQRPQAVSHEDVQHQLRAPARAGGTHGQDGRERSGGGTARGPQGEVDGRRPPHSRLLGGFVGDRETELGRVGARAPRWRGRGELRAVSGVDGGPHLSLDAFKNAKHKGLRMYPDPEERAAVLWNAVERDDLGKLSLATGLESSSGSADRGGDALP
ncbi:hypothetical protein DL764_004227 [Monosporascus ibericus]|uniref:Uncharacterized protein n=1 Tax=Monosporascus ibericus TaxID=155417 RepID=A0A4Q4TDJ3_9PEZI|nr:hypothetical protein DL764_004227 [Monosporascus ibericus]